MPLCFDNIKPFPYTSIFSSSAGFIIFAKHLKSQNSDNEIQQECKPISKKSPLKRQICLLFLPGGYT